MLRKAYCVKRARPMARVPLRGTYRVRPIPQSALRLGWLLVSVPLRGTTAGCLRLREALSVLREALFT